MHKTALIFGVTGQDGSILAAQLLKQGYMVHGVHRHTSTDNLSRIQHILDDPNAEFKLHRGDVTDFSRTSGLIYWLHPQEIYNEADQDHVSWSHDLPSVALSTTVGGASNILEAVKKFSRDSKVFQPVSATMFAKSNNRCNEKSPLDPRSPYACAKAHVYHLCRYYREQFGMFVTTGIMYSHESCSRGPDYLLQKICRGVAAIKKGKQSRLDLYGLHDRYDIGWAEDYMLWAQRVMQLEKPDDFVMATGVGESVFGLICYAFQLAELRYHDEHKRLMDLFDKTNGESANAGFMAGDSSKLARAIAVPRYEGYFHPTTPFESVEHLMKHHLEKE